MPGPGCDFETGDGVFCDRRDVHVVTFAGMREPGSPWLWLCPAHRPDA